MNSKTIKDLTNFLNAIVNIGYGVMQHQSGLAKHHSIYAIKRYQDIRSDVQKNHLTSKEKELLMDDWHDMKKTANSPGSPMKLDTTYHYYHFPKEQ